MLQNVVGYDAFGPAEPKFGGNVNEPFVDGSATGLLMRAEPGKEATIDRPTTIFVGGRISPATCDCRRNGPSNCIWP